MAAQPVGDWLIGCIQSRKNAKSKDHHSYLRMVGRGGGGGHMGGNEPGSRSSPTKDQFFKIFAAKRQSFLIKIAILE